MFLQVAYQSKLHEPLAAASLLTIQKSAIQHNSKFQVTSFLYHDTGRVLQILEGPTDAVEQTIDRISHNKLHYAITTRAMMRTRYRAFVNCPFGTTRFDDPVFRQVHSVLQFPDILDLNTLEALRVLRMVARRKRRIQLRTKGAFFAAFEEGTNADLHAKAVGE